MTKLLLKIFVKDKGAEMTTAIRQQYGKVASCTGIATKPSSFFVKGSGQVFCLTAFLLSLTLSTTFLIPVLL